VADTVTKEQRSLNMSLIRSKETKPEVFVRSVLHRLGFRFRKNVKDLPGKPDIVLPKYKTVIFVHGCFWHQHKGCRRATIPKSNTDYWIPKLTGNVKRDILHKADLKKAGWNVAVVWECETKVADKLKKKLKNIFAKIIGQSRRESAINPH
jgi:DNA mismatch endonuclease (patch repair protein)